MTDLLIPAAINDRDATHVAELFASLGDPTRVKIIATLLQGRMNVQALAGLVGISESGVSHQLRGLRQLRLVRAQKEGRQVFYSLDDEHVTELFQKALDHVIHG